MHFDSFSAVLPVAVPLVLIGALAGALRAASLGAREPKRRRLLAFAWVAVLLAGVPLWLFLAAALRLF